jgi:hypothetical protein
LAVTCQLTVTDCFGNTVRLDHSNWKKHLPRHPEIEPYHDDLPTVLSDPEFVIIDPKTQAAHFNRPGLGRGRYASLYLRVVVQYYGASGGKIVSAYFTDALSPKGTVLWNRPRKP